MANETDEKKPAALPPVDKKALEAGTSIWKPNTGEQLEHRPTFLATDEEEIGKAFGGIPRDRLRFAYAAESSDGKPGVTMKGTRGK